MAAAANDIVDMETAAPQHGPITMSSKSSVKRNTPANEVVFEGWVEWSLERNITGLAMSYWRLSRITLSIFQSNDLNTKQQFGIVLDDIVSIEEAAQDSPFHFVIRSVGTIVYVGRRSATMRPPGEAAYVPQEPNQQYQYYNNWMCQLRTMWIPRIRDDGNIHDLYDINTNDVLGQGQYGIVYTATHKATGETVALKAIDYANANIKTLSPETRIPKVLNHPGVIRIIGLYYTKDKIYIATEKLHGDLLGFILDQPTRRLDERVTKFITYQIISAIAFLNNYDVVHCDVKPENVLLVEKHPFPQIKLCDFGYSRIVNKGSVRRGSFVGTMNYLPPEAISRTPTFNNALDTWSAGVIVYVSLSGVFPYNPSQDITPQVADDAVFFRPAAWRTITPQGKDIVRRLMELSARKRGDCQRFKRHLWFTQDYQFWCDLKAFEERLISQNPKGDKRRWWSDDLNVDETMEKLRAAKNYPPWTQIGCQFITYQQQQQQPATSLPTSSGAAPPQQQQ